MAEVVHKAVSVSVDDSLLSSPSSSTESSFRELDDVFLQSQAKIWIGEILQTRLNEEISIADLLSDGELLYEVSREIWSMLAAKRLDLRGLRSPSHRYDPFVSRKSSGRYRPYSNVDSFLKVCKILGLAGIDLFSPSDVVEKRNTRKVCMCIRSLSKKVRSRQLNVPDFDIVTYTVAMPTDMVGCIRRSWEMSHCSPSSSAASSSHDSYQNLGRSRRLNQSLADSGRKYNLYNEESDEADSDLIFQPGNKTNSFSYDTSSCVDTDLLDSTEVSSVPKDHTCERCSSLLNTPKQEEDGYYECCCEAESLLKSMESFFSPNMESDHQQHSMPVPSFDSNAQLKSIFPHTLDIDDNASVVGDSDEKTPTRKDFSGESDLSIFTFDEAYRNNVTSLHSVDGNFHASGNTSSCAWEASAVNRSRISAVDNISFTSVQWDMKGKYRVHIASSELHSHVDFLKDILFQTKATEDALCPDNSNFNISSNGTISQSESGSCEPLLKMQTCSVNKHTQNVGQVRAQVSKTRENDCVEADDDCDDKKHEKLQDPAAKEGKSGEKPRRRLLIKSVASGTAVVGAVLLFFHLRKNGGRKTGEEDKEYSQTRKANSRDMPMQKGRKGKTSNGVYPSEKLKFGN